MIFNLLLLAISESAAAEVRSVLVSLVHFTTEAMQTHVLKYEGHAELALPLTGFGRIDILPHQRADPAPSWSQDSELP